MPRLADLQQRFYTPFVVNPANSVDETLVLDSRAHIRPAQFVESKLLTLLRLAGRSTTKSLPKPPKPR
jgi:hypothetical protein